MLMESFKKFCEAMTKHSDAFLILMSDIKLDRGNSCKIWEMCGKRSKFRHITDKKGANFLINNKDKNVTISAMKLGKRTKGILSYGDIILLLDADYETWFPEDAYTFIGEDGKRWTSPKARRFTDIFGEDFLEEYKSGLRKLIQNKHPELHEFLMQSDYRYISGNNIIGESDSINNFSYDFNSLNETVFNEWEKSNKKLVDKFTQDALKYQLDFLDKRSEEIQDRLINMFRNANKSKDNRQMYSMWQDEAVVSNVKVDKVLIKGFDKLSFNYFFENFGDEILSSYETKEIVNHLFEFIFSSKFKGLFTFIDEDGTFKSGIFSSKETD